MEQINELIDLAQRLDALLDDMDRDVHSVHISRVMGEVTITASAEFIMKNFETFDVSATGTQDLPFKIETEVEGIRFSGRVGLSKLELLRGRIPDEWIEEATKPKKIFGLKASRQNDVNLPSQIKSPLALACE